MNFLIILRNEICQNCMHTHLLNESHMVPVFRKMNWASRGTYSIPQLTCLSINDELNGLTQMFNKQIVTQLYIQHSFSIHNKLELT